MNHIISQQLKEWRSRKANLEGVERYIILHNKAIEAIAETLPCNEEEFKAIKGLGGKKFEKYGKEILAIINKSTNDKMADEAEMQEDVLSVSNFLDTVNSTLTQLTVAIKGEVSSVSDRGHVYFSLKDKEDDSVLSCLIWERNYQICGIELEEGMEVIIRGFPEVYKPSGKFTFKASTIELVGEGALKKAYDELRKKLTQEGIFDESRKKAIPSFPYKIGLITSRDGAVIHDFQTNLGRFGYKIHFVDSRVEGIQAVRDLIDALRYFKDKDIDLLVVIRGGGSLESLQAFNNEALIRELANYPLPVLCGIGHDKDVPLFCLAADKAVSTPSIVAGEINRTWEQALEKVRLNESNIINKYSTCLTRRIHLIDNYSFGMSKFYQRIVKKVSSIDISINNIFNNLNSSLILVNEKVNISSMSITDSFSSALADAKKTIFEDRFSSFALHIISARKSINSFSKILAKDYYDIVNRAKQQISQSEKALIQNDPNRLLKLGYSIIFSDHKVIKSVDQLNKNDMLISRLSDGEVLSSVKEKRKRSYGEI